MQALSKRIHYGKFVAEAKFREAPVVYEAAIRSKVNLFMILLTHPYFIDDSIYMTILIDVLASNCRYYICVLQDRHRLLHLLTHETVETAVKRRVEMKARKYGQVLRINERDDLANPVYKIKPSLVANLYGDVIMPLTKEVQIEYLLRRLD